MKTKMIGGAVALACVSLVALGFANSVRPIFGQHNEGRAVHAVNMDMAPQNKFGMREAMSPGEGAKRSPPPPPAAMVAADAAAAAAADVAAAPATPIKTPGSISVSLPRMAYAYDYGFQVDASKLTALQRRHADLCEAQGPRGCRILELEQASDEGGDGMARGRLKLAVASSQARKFGTQLASTLDAAGGQEISASISGEDLSKDMVDTEARLRARTLLRDRLMDVLATRKGSVAELVEAERGVAQVNEEIDEARSWLTEMQGRVEYSVVTIDYVPVGASLASAQSNGFLDPIRAALGNIGGLLGITLALLITLLTIAVPMLTLVWVLRRSWPWLQAKWGQSAPAGLADGV